MQGAIAAGDEHTARAGATILRAGGNAIDAAVAAALAAFVAEPLLCGAGGAGMLVACRAGEEPIAINFFSTMPSLSLDRDDAHFDVVRVDFGATTQDFHVGRASAAVPLALAGLAEATRELGTMSLSDLVRPAVSLAQDGLVLREQTASVFSLLWPIMARDPETVAFYGSDGEAPAVGRRMTNPALAEMLIEYAREGDVPSSFVEGMLEAFGPSSGGHLTRSDMVAANVEIQAPFETRFGQRQLYTSPMLGGRVMAHIVDRLDVGSTDPVAFAEAARSAHIMRNSVSPRGSTTHISVIDGEGNAASMTLTNGEGCGHLVASVGVQMNNFLGEEDLNPEGFFLHPPGSRLPTMIAPTLVLKDGRVVLAAGSGGANRIRSAVSRVILLAREVGLERAVRAARIHAENDHVWFEDFDFDAGLAQAFAQRFEQVSVFAEPAFYFGGVHAVGVSERGEIQAVGDARRAGVGIMVA